jgi:hypothetical protein
MLIPVEVRCLDVERDVCVVPQLARDGVREQREPTEAVVQQNIGDATTAVPVFGIVSAVTEDEIGRAISTDVGKAARRVYVVRPVHLRFWQSSLTYRERSTTVVDPDLRTELPSADIAHVQVQIAVAIDVGGVSGVWEIQLMTINSLSLAFPLSEPGLGTR